MIIAECFNRVFRIPEGKAKANAATLASMAGSHFLSQKKKVDSAQSLATFRAMQVKAKQSTEAIKSAREAFAGAFEQYRSDSRDLPWKSLGEWGQIAETAFKGLWDTLQ